MKRFNQSSVLDIRIRCHLLGRKLDPRVGGYSRGTRTRAHRHPGGDVQNPAPFEALRVFVEHNGLPSVELAIEIEECQGALFRKRDVEVDRSQLTAVQ